jgi:hypothetical protein
MFDALKQKNPFWINFVFVPVNFVLLKNCILEFIFISVIKRNGCPQKVL